MAINFVAILLSVAGVLTPVSGALVHNAGSGSQRTEANPSGESSNLNEPQASGSICVGIIGGAAMYEYNYKARENHPLSGWERFSGLLCNYAKAAELKTDSWVTVEGTLFIGKHIYNNVAYDDPQISVTKITPAEEVKGYVTPY